MNQSITFKNITLLILALIVGLGLASALNSLALAGSQGTKMSNPVETKVVMVSSPEPSTAAGQTNTPAAAKYYLAKSGKGSDGLTWPTAYTNVQDALTAAIPGDQIWVATGIYTPGTSQTDSFNLKPGVEIYGGFKTGDTQFSDRDWINNPTVLSGDIDGNDITDANCIVTTTTNISLANAHHVLTTKNVTETSVLDGFTVTAGKASASFPNSLGGGLYCDGSGFGNYCSPTLRRLVFSGNRASVGGAIFNDGFSNGNSSPTMIEIQFSGNSAATNGGAIANDGSVGDESSPSMTNVRFSGNRSLKYGGAVYKDGSQGISSPEIFSATFTANTAKWRGGAIYNNGSQGLSSPILFSITLSGNSTSQRGWAIYNDGSQGLSSPKLYSITLAGNSAAQRAGAIYNDGGNSGNSSPELVNVILSGNRAGQRGGALYNDGFNGQSRPKLTNVTISGNFAESTAGAMYNDGQGGISNPDVRNSIFWNNQDETGSSVISDTIYNDLANITITHSLVQGSGGSSSWISDTSYINGGGNLDTDPLFTLDIDPASAPTSAGNLRLQNISPAIDAGDNKYITGISTDRDGLQRIVDGNSDATPTVDIGAYEVQIDFNYNIYLPVVFR